MGAEMLAESGDPLDMLMPLSEEELGIKFDELTTVAAEQPDDELALTSLRSLVTAAQETGQIALAMQMAATLGAMACLHPHLEWFANEIGASIEGAVDHTHKNKDEDDESDNPGKKKKKKSKASKPRQRRQLAAKAARRRPSNK